MVNTNDNLKIFEVSPIGFDTEILYSFLETSTNLQKKLLHIKVFNIILIGFLILSFYYSFDASILIAIIINIGSLIYCHKQYHGAIAKKHHEMKKAYDDAVALNKYRLSFDDTHPQFSLLYDKKFIVQWFENFYQECFTETIVHFSLGHDSLFGIRTLDISFPDRLSYSAFLLTYK